MCMKAYKPPKPITPPPTPPPPNADDKPQTPVVDEGFGNGDELMAKRRGRAALTIPLGGLNIPR